MNFLKTLVNTQITSEWSYKIIQKDAFFTVQAGAKYPTHVDSTYLKGNFEQCLAIDKLKVLLR